MYYAICYSYCRNTSLNIHNSHPVQCIMVVSKVVNVHYSVIAITSKIDAKQPDTTNLCCNVALLLLFYVKTLT